MPFLPRRQVSGPLHLFACAQMAEMMKNKLARTLTQAWCRRGLLAWLLWPLSLIYGLLVALRCALYRSGLRRSTRLPVPVIVVGNVVAGGAGKTPVVLALVAHLQQQGVAVGVVSRGYGRSLPGCLEVTPERSAQEVGDEPALIQRRSGVPVFVAARRAEAAAALLARYPQTRIIISDDGLQHLSLARDLEIGVFDDRGVGNGWLLPAGPLREPWPRALDLLLHTGNKPAFAGFCGQRRLADYAVRADGSRLDLARLTQANAGAIQADMPHCQPSPSERGSQTNSRALGELPLAVAPSATGGRLGWGLAAGSHCFESHPAKTVSALCPAAAEAEANASVGRLLALAAIARPEAFFAMLRAKGLPLADTLALPDHHDFNSWQRNNYKGYSLICTEKDAVKLWPLEPQALAVPLLFDLPEAFWQAFNARLAGLLAQSEPKQTA